MDFIQGTFVKEGVKIEILGSDQTGYRYRWLESTNDDKIDYSTCLPVLIMDYSASMQNSNSAQPATDGTKTLCKSLFSKGITKILLVYFGATSYPFEVTMDNYAGRIDETLRGYFANQEAYQLCGKFKIDATVPTYAFNDVYKYLNTTKENEIFITFMTDGQFNNYDNNYYDNEWKKIVTNLYTLKKTINIASIGYKDDYLKNIQQMKIAFDGVRIPFTYTTISKAIEIEATLLNTSEEFDIGCMPKLDLKNGLTIVQGECVYAKDKLFDDLIPANIIENDTDKTGVSALWVQKVISLEISIGLKENDIRTKMGSTQSKSLYVEIVKDLVPYFTNLHKLYMELKSEYKSLKSRDIPSWKSLYEKIETFSKLFRDIQLFVSSELDEKKSFEIATKINKSITSQHARSLQRRKITNEANKAKNKIFKITLINEDPVTLKCVYENEKYTIEKLNAPIDKLNEHFTCTYSLEEWSDLLNTLIGIPFQYTWKSNDDWTPSKSCIDYVSLASTVSMDGYKETQSIFGVIESPEHKTLYGDNKYISSAHDKCNSFLPIAVDPFFCVKLDMLKQHLGHMMAGSNLAYRNPHLLLYVAVLKQCFNQLLDNDSEKLRHIILLLLNTFKLATDKISVIHDKNQISVSKEDILLNIAKGNTAPYLFASAWESAIFLLSTSESDLMKSFEKYKSDSNEDVTNLDQYKFQLWKMVLRHMHIMSFDKKDTWESHKTWDLKNASEMELILKTEGEDAFNKYLMSENKLLNIPNVIKNDLEMMRDGKLIKLFKSLVNFGDTLNDSVWNEFNKSFLPIKFIQKTTINILFTDEIYDTIGYWSYWESYAYGHKECYPVKTQKEISKVVTNNINAKYGESLTGAIADVKEYIDFKSRTRETRFLPVTFTPAQSIKINELFKKVYLKRCNEDEFKTEFKSIMDKKYCEQIGQTLVEDGVDVLANLFVYCSRYLHSLKMKTSRLPRNCPANPSSPYFLQDMGEINFVQYYRPCGFGWTDKKYRDWIDDLHTYMDNRLCYYTDAKSFADDVMHHVLTFRTAGKISPDQYRSEAEHFFNKFKKC